MVVTSKQPRSSDLTGFSCGEWTVISHCVGAYWVCRCSCGFATSVYRASLIKGLSTKCKKCGMKHATKHGMYGTKIYRIWNGIKNRCLCKTHHSYPEYGGSGIGMDKEWELFSNFYRDMGDVPDGMSIDRIDGSKGYYKENCRWATPKDQTRNRGNTIKFDIDGVIKPMSEWCEIYGISYTCVRNRIRKGWSYKEAICTIAKPRKPNKPKQE